MMVFVMAVRGSGLGGYGRRRGFAEAVVRLVSILSGWFLQRLQIGAQLGRGADALRGELGRSRATGTPQIGARRCELGNRLGDPGNALGRCQPGFRVLRVIDTHALGSSTAVRAVTGRFGYPADRRDRQDRANSRTRTSCFAPECR